MTEEEYADFTGRLEHYDISQAEFIRQAITRATIRPIVTVSPVNDDNDQRAKNYVDCFQKYIFLKRKKEIIMQDESMRQEWVHCPVCGNKTRLRLREDTVLTHFPLFCPKCKKESLIDAKEYIVKEIK